MCVPIVESFIEHKGKGHRYTRCKGTNVTANKSDKSEKHSPDDTSSMSGGAEVTARGIQEALETNPVVLANAKRKLSYEDGDNDAGNSVGKKVREQYILFY